jgi:hypothetical protein
MRMAVDHKPVEQRVHQVQVERAEGVLPSGKLPESVRMDGNQMVANEIAEEEIYRRRGD